jgi:hypothetical protein
MNVVTADHLTVGKEQAAARQVDAAIDALTRGDFDIAITLAGAAEGMLDRSGFHAWTFMRDHTLVQHVNKKEWMVALNYERDWLKHSTPNFAAEITLTVSDAALMIVRAASKLEVWSSKVEEFNLWLTSNLEEVFREAR